MPLKTIIFQSQAKSNMQPWVEACLETVRIWATQTSVDYQFLGDEIFEFVPEYLRYKFKDQPVILTDLARLRLLNSALNDAYDRAVWIDADLLVFNPYALDLIKAFHAVGREVWVQKAGSQLKVYRKVHNAFLMGTKDDSFLPFYADAAETMLRRAEGPLVPQFIGPKLLTAQHNITALHVQESVGMVSPLALRDALNGGGPALDLTLAGHERGLDAVNLSASLLGIKSDEVCHGEADYEKFIEQTLSAGFLK